MTTNGQASQSAWVREALHQFEAPLVRYAQRITGDLEQARDVVQETFLKLCHQNPADLDGHLSQWLFTVCRNRALDVHRKERRMTTATDFDQRDADTGTPSPEQAAQNKDMVASILSFMEKLPNNQQEVIRLKFQNELSYREISDITGLTVTNVGFLLHVGIRRLRELMKAELAH